MPSGLGRRNVTVGRWRLHRSEGAIKSGPASGGPLLDGRRWLTPATPLAIAPFIRSPPRDLRLYSLARRSGTLSVCVVTALGRRRR